jgi:hypothetical protein
MRAPPVLMQETSRLPGFGSLMRPLGCFLHPFSLAISCVNFSNVLEYADRNNLVGVDEDNPYFFARFAARLSSSAGRLR